MSWRDLLQTSEEETVISPWIGGRILHTYNRTWKIEGKLPREHGWHIFSTKARTAKWSKATEAPFDVLKDRMRGYLVGDRLVSDDTKIKPNIVELTQNFERVHLIEPGLSRFARIIAGRFCENGPLIYENLEMLMGPEDEVTQAFLDQKKTVDDILGVTPALDAAFRIETWRRDEAEKHRREEQERREKEERRRQIIESLGDGAARRELAKFSFEDAARAALAVGGATLLDHRPAYRKNEVVVTFRLGGRRYQCTCHAQTLRIIDAGICLTAHYDDPDFEGGTRGDTFFTLESLPGVILQAEGRQELVVFRHVD